MRATVTGLLADRPLTDGLLADVHLAEWIFGRMDIWPIGHLAECHYRVRVKIRAKARVRVTQMSYYNIL